MPLDSLVGRASLFQPGCPFAPDATPPTDARVNLAAIYGQPPYHLYGAIMAPGASTAHLRGSIDVEALIMSDPAKVRAENYLAPETLAQLGPFELRAKMIVEGVMSGMHRSPYQGMAVEFAQHRQYVAGDDLKHLDWKVYGRSDK